MPRIPFDPTNVSLTKPGLRETVFQDERYRRAGLDALCAECARLAYVDFDVVPGPGMRRLTEALALVGCAAPTPIIDTRTGTQAYATVTKEGRVLVSFRGTQAFASLGDAVRAILSSREAQPDEIKDLLRDANAWLVPWTPGGQVHKGFAEGFGAVSAQVKAELHRATSSLPPIFTGHSLGAALATLAASEVKGATLVTFGSPRVGDASFVATLDSTAIRRYVDCSDIVTKVPPALPGFYTHCDGELLYIDRNGDVRRDASTAGKFVDQVSASVAYFARYAFRKGNVVLRSLANHSPINYIRAFTSEP